MQNPIIFYEDYFNDFEDLFKDFGEIVNLKEDYEISSLNNEQYLYYIQDGIFILSLEHEKGESKTFCYHSVGTLTPYSLARPKDGVFKIELDFFIIKAITPIQAIKIKPHIFYQIMQENSALAITMLDYVVDHSNLYLSESLHLSYNSAFTKTCNFIFIYTQHLMKYGIRLTQREIGDFIGETRLEVARVLKKLRELNVVKTSRANIQVLNIDKLKELANIHD